MNNTMEFGKTTASSELAPTPELNTGIRPAEVHYNPTQPLSVHEAEQAVSQAFSEVVAETVEATEYYLELMAVDTQTLINVRNDGIRAEQARAAQ